MLAAIATRGRRIAREPYPNERSHDARARSSDITKAVGNTPIVRLNRVTAGLPVEIYVKCEYLNPGGSHKDRLAANMLRRAEEDGLKPGGTIVEATSGNTGASLALLAALRGYKCVFVMPDKMSQEKIAHLRAFGARVVVCPTAVEPEDPRSYYQVAERIARETPNSLLREPVPQPREPRGALPLDRARDLGSRRAASSTSSAPGMGTGGTISGTGKYLKREEAGASRSSASIRSARSTTTSSRRAASPSRSRTRSRASARTSSRRR